MRGVGIVLYGPRGIDASQDIGNENTVCGKFIVAMRGNPD
jgi:hypothetical protein